MHPIRFDSLLWIVLASSSQLRAAPLELDELRQQYHKAVVIPFEEGRKSLDAKYTAALDSAAKAAQQKGSLDEVVALTGEQKR